MTTLSQEEILERIRQLYSSLSKDDRLELLNSLTTLLREMNAAMEEYIASSAK